MKALLIFTILLLLTGCKNENTTTINKEEENFKYTTTCIDYNFDIEGNEDGITDSYSVMEYSYNSIDDKKVFSVLYLDITFDNYENAKEFHEATKKEWEDEGVNSELSKNEDDEAHIFRTMAGYEKNIPSKVIEEQKKQGFTCETKNNKK